MKIFENTEHDKLCILDTNDMENIEETVRLLVNNEMYKTILVPKVYRYHVLENKVRKMLTKDGEIIHYINNVDNLGD